MFIGRREIFRNKRYEELCVISIQEVRGRRNTDERAKRNGIKIEKNWAETEPCGTLQVRGDDGELCGGNPTIDVRDEI